MDAMDVGTVLFCWACARPAEPSEFEGPGFGYAESFQCSCCKRPFAACPCSPPYDEADMPPCEAEKT